MKKILSFVVAMIAILSLFGCEDSNHNKNEELVVFAASSLTESLMEIADIYNIANPDVELIYNFDSSGTLETQIEEGSVCDVFISASQKPMDSLSCVLSDTKFDILQNKVCLVVPKDNPKNLSSFEDMIAHLSSGNIMLAIGNSDVPVGEYTLKIFDYYNLDIEKLEASGCLTYGSNVKEVSTQVTESMVDCGIVYQTDASTAHLDVVDIATKKMCGEVIYPAAVIKSSDNPELAKNYLDFLKSDEVSKIFQKYGFTPTVH